MAVQFFFIYSVNSVLFRMLKGCLRYVLYKLTLCWSKGSSRFLLSSIFKLILILVFLNALTLLVLLYVENMVVCFKDQKTGRCLNEIPNGDSNFTTEMYC